MIDNAERDSVSKTDSDYTFAPHFAETWSGELIMDVPSEADDRPIGHTVILLYPGYMTGDFGADIYVGHSCNKDPLEAVKEVQRQCADENSIFSAEDSDPVVRDSDDFRCIGVIPGEHSFVLDATSFERA